MTATEYRPGEIIDGFVLDRKIYASNLSDLWRVDRPGAEFSLVMKLPRLGPEADPASVVGFEVEQMILPMLTGPHVPRHVASADFSGQAYIVSEFIAGGCLSARMNGGPLPIAEAAEVGARIADALHSLHGQHVIHLDLKPQNVLFRPTGEAVLIDYGMAHHGDLPDLLTEEFRLPMGTGATMAPEQVWRIRDDPRSDLFSLGVLLYAMIAGRSPFGNPTTESGLRRRLYVDPPPPRRHNPDCPDWLQEIILGCLETDPAARFATAAEVGFLLRNPDQVTLTGRATRLRPGGPLVRLRKWLRAFTKPVASGRPMQEHLARNPIIVAALEMRSDPAVLDAIRTHVERLLRATPEARLACLAVRRKSRESSMSVFAPENHGRNPKRQVQALIELKHWAHGLGLESRRVTFQVLESPDPAATIIDYARANHVGQIVLGAKSHSSEAFAAHRMERGGLPSPSQMARLGPVATRIVAECPCTVTVVRG